MRQSRILLTLSALALAGALTACGGDDPSTDAGASPSRSAGATSKADEQVSRTCRAEVQVTGSVEASWTGKGASQTNGSGPKAIYRAEDGDNQIVVYASGPDFKATANVTIGGRTFTTPLGVTDGLEAKPSGKKADVDADTIGVQKDDKAHVAATFACH